MASLLSLSEWEFVDDDGFVYKRRKRRPDPTITTVAPAPPDPLAEENIKKTKKRSLMNLRVKYQEEISRWELLSNMLKAMQDKALLNQLAESSLHSPVGRMTENSYYHRQLDELLARAECEESMMEDLSNLCDVVEAVCSFREERLKQRLMNLPIWTSSSSPQVLMTSLCGN